MSAQHTMTKATPQEVVISFAMGFVPILIAIVLIVQLVVSIRESQIDIPADDAKVLERIKPVGEVAVSDPNAARVERSGDEVFNAVCASCHSSGALGAPKLNNKADWASRIGKGLGALVKNAIGGIGAMPPRGGGADFSDTEIARAVAYLANSAGANFKVTEASAPTPEASAAAAPAAAGAPDGKAIYDASCAACHGTGVAGAPKLGDKAAWAPRMKAGIDQLVASATKGKGAMPAKGGNASLSDADIKATVDYMVGPVQVVPR
jgi:cytochrome c5